MAQASLSKAREEGGSVRLVVKEKFFAKRTPASSKTSAAERLVREGNATGSDVTMAIDDVALGFRLFSFSSPSAVSMEMCLCLVAQAQEPAECVSTVNIDHNTIHPFRCTSRLTPGGSIAMET